jgi:TetR/AcrR family transcriptional regulator, transcriptional repressor for nem operon
VTLVNPGEAPVKALPTTERGRRSRAAIVRAAGELMHRRGLAGPSIDEILVASNTGKSQLYHYFDGRTDLSAAVLEHQFDRVMAAQPALHDPACAELVTWRDQVLKALLESSYGMCPLGTFVGQVADDAELSGTLAKLFDRWQQGLAELVSRAQKHGGVRPEVDPAEAGRALLVALQGGTALSHVHREAEPLRRALDAAIAVLASGAAGSRELARR